VKNPLNPKRRELVENIFSHINQQYEHLNPQNVGKFFYLLSKSIQSRRYLDL
jgi:hypothetical protein